MIIAGLLCCLAAGSKVRAEEPEQARFSDKAFQRGLRQLGLTDLLDYYARKHPPKDPVEAALLRRELRLNIYQDATIPNTERMAALEEASAILRDLIGQFSEDRRRHEWRLELGRDLILKAEPYYNNILFREGAPEDRSTLAAITTEALAVYDDLVNELQDAIARIDSLPIREFEARARSGEIERVEAILPRARYFQTWASYYHCLTLEPSNRARELRLQGILDYLTEESMLVDVEHRLSHVQAQALLLAGMCCRLLGSPERAENYLFKAGATAAGISDFAERHNLRWVVSLATLERVKNFRDRGNYDLALQTLQRYRSNLPQDTPTMFSLHFTLALLEGSVYRAQAERLGPSEAEQREQLLLNARQPLIDLARRHPQHQTEIYTTLFEQLGEVGRPEALDPFEKSLFIAAMLRRTTRLNSEMSRIAVGGDVGPLREQRSAALQQAVRVANQLLQDDSALSLELRPEARFNLAVCYHEQDQPLAALEQLNALVRDHPRFEKAETAAEYAVRIAESLYAGSTAGGRAALRPLYLEALQSLTEKFPDHPLTSRNAYRYGQVLQEDGRYLDAARQFGRLPATHSEYLSALFGAAECQLLQLRQWHGRPDPVIQAQIRAVLQAADFYRTRAISSESRNPGRYSASLLISAEALLAGPSPQPLQALEMLEQFETVDAADPEQVGRGMRLKIVAYQQLGRLEQARKIIPQYLRSDPLHAGATLQGLLNTFKQEIRDAEEAGRESEALSKAQDALIVARNLFEWSGTVVSGLNAESRLAFKLEYGEALLRARESEQARVVFQEAVDQDTASSPDGRSRNGRAVYGLAEAYYHGGRPREALPLFHRLYAESAEDSDLWWRAFMRELQCRRLLGEDSAVLVSLINQKQVLFRELGGYREPLQKMREELSRTP